MAELTIKTGLEKPLTKLIETISDGVGALYEPSRIRKRAEAEADAALVRARAELDVAQLFHQARLRVDARELQRERNLQQIIDGATKHLPGEVSPDPVDSDWTAEFLNCAQDVSNEEMQSLWARILAGEIAQPTTFSRRTLGAVRVLEHQEAALFTALCSFFWKVEGRFYAHFKVPGDDPFTVASIKFGALDHLKDIGLLAHLPARWDNQIGFTFVPGAQPIEYWGRRYAVLPVADYDPPVTYPVTFLTSTGSELAPISGAEPRSDYETRVISALRADKRLTVQELA